MGASALTGKRVLITGAGGQLGRYLAPAAAAAGATVITTGSRPGVGIDMVADLADSESVRRLFGGDSFDIILHAAACTDVDGIERDPARGAVGNTLVTTNVALESRRSGAYLLAVSTDMVFAGDGGAPYAEDAATSPISAYGASKLVAEQAVLEADSAFGVARTAWLYGGAGKHFPRTVLGVLRDRGAIAVVDDERGSPTFAGDLAGALVAVAASAGSGVFHLVNAGSASRFDLARATASLAGVDPNQVTPISTDLFLERYPLPARRPPDSSLRNLRAAAMGIDMRHWREALAAYVPRLAVEMASAPVMK